MKTIIFKDEMRSYVFLGDNLTWKDIDIVKKLNDFSQLDNAEKIVDLQGKCVLKHPFYGKGTSINDIAFMDKDLQKCAAACHGRVSRMVLGEIISIGIDPKPEKQEKAIEETFEKEKVEIKQENKKKKAQKQ